MARSSAVQRDGEEAHAGAIASDSMVYVTTRGIASMLVQRAISFVTHDSRCGFAGRGLLRGATELMMFEKFAIQRVLVKARAICLCSRHLGKTFVVVSSIASSRLLFLRREEELELGIACTMRAIVRSFMPAHAIYPCPLLCRGACDQTRAFLVPGLVDGREAALLDGAQRFVMGSKRLQSFVRNYTVFTLSIVR